MLLEFAVLAAIVRADRAVEEGPTRPSVVLVDDDDLYREALSADLADRGFAVSCFADGPSFLAAVSDGMEAQVALLDWALPTMSGFELLNALRQRGSGLPVIFLTGHAMVERELQALDRGALDFVDKARGVEVLGAPATSDY
jgi:two-component system response regulator ChvI